MFYRSKIVQTHNLLTTAIKPIELKLFDGTSNAIITQSVDLPVNFPTDESITFNFYVTPLDPSCSVVLGYNWLTRYNLMIDWELGRIIFCPQLLDQSISTPTSTARAASLPSQKASLSEETPEPSEPSVSILSISIIGAAAFMRACKLPGSQCYRIQLSDPTASTMSASTSNDVPDLSEVPAKYHNFADVFSKSNAYMLAPH